MNFPKSTPDSSEHTALKSFINDKTSLEDAVTQFTTLPPSTSAEDKLSTSWDALMLLSAETPADSDLQDKLCSAVISIRKSTTSIGQIEGKQVSWSQLPLLGRQAREHWNYDEKVAQEDDKVSEMWSNANAFAARLTASADAFDGTDALDFSLYAIWAFRSALEDKDDVPAATVKASAMWIYHAGATIRRLSKEQRSFEGNVAKSGDKYLNKDWTGFEVERWKTWKNRFANYSEVAADEQVRKIAKDVGRKMSEIAG